MGSQTASSMSPSIAISISCGSRQGSCAVGETSSPPLSRSVMLPLLLGSVAGGFLGPFPIELPPDFAAILRHDPDRLATNWRLLASLAHPSPRRPLRP